MSNYTLVLDCPYCHAQHSTCDVKGSNATDRVAPFINWEFFCVCRSCRLGFCVKAVLMDLNRPVTVLGRSGLLPSRKVNQLISLVTQGQEIRNYFTDFKVIEIILTAESPPELIPPKLEIIFKEAAQCLAIGCFNASGAMFRLCLDMVTKDIIESNNEHKPTAQDKKTIHTRLVWIFNNKILPNSLEALSRGIKDDGNDAAHDGTIGKAEAEDLLDFTRILLERVYTEPERIRLAEVRRAERRQN